MHNDAYISKPNFYKQIIYRHAKVLHCKKEKGSTLATCGYHWAVRRVNSLQKGTEKAVLQKCIVYYTWPNQRQQQIECSFQSTIQRAYHS